MRRRQSDTEAGGFALLSLFLLGAISCCMVYSYLSTPSFPSQRFEPVSDLRKNLVGEEGEGSCCRGVEHLELWGQAVNWGSDFKVNSSEDCCLACKKMCRGGDNERCRCDSWVFCANRQACGARFGECWLKKQKDSFNPDRRDSGDHVMWTSGLIFGQGEDVIGLETEYGILRVKLFPDCAPHSVSYILDLLQPHHSLGCHFYRAESRGSFWDAEGNHLENAPFGPPFALLQGTAEAHGTVFKDMPHEFCPTIRRGSVGWVGSGPEFFISLANHAEWMKPYTVFGSVLPQDMVIVETISQLPTKPEIWSNISVSVLEKSIDLRFRRVKMVHNNTQR